MSKLKWMAGSCFALALTLLAWGCSGGKPTSVALYSPVKGEHPANWMQVHYSEYAKAPDQCRSCHGSTSDPALAGGISKVSCFTCHTTVNHPAGWGAPGQHGRSSAQLPVSGDPIAMAAFAHCAKCHGADYKGGVSGSSCMACHTKAPHPSRPWTGLGTAVSHTATHYSNAPECFKCHAAGANSTVKPLTTPPAGTAPGCFNNTMCHGTNVP